MHQPPLVGGRFLHQSGCDIHKTNNFGCNAALWSAQGGGNSESMKWLFERGSDFGRINSNGHSALHKAAQRGSSGAVKWLASTFLVKKEGMDAAALIAPDNEGNCPSDLCGMEGHESLAHWLSNQECDYFLRAVTLSKSIDDVLGNQCIPCWFQKELQAALTWVKHRPTDTEVRWGAGRGARSMASHIILNATRSIPKETAEIQSIKDFNDID